MGASSPPYYVPQERQKFIDAFYIQSDPTLEGDVVYFMTDTNEWLAEDDDQAALIAESYPGAKILIAPEFTPYHPDVERHPTSNDSGPYLLYEPLKNGPTKKILISKETWDALQKKFEEEFDPETCERRWIVEARKRRDARLRQQSSLPPSSSATP